ncbi:MAG: helix-turn-helix domain-containing protein, partial [Terrimicrobiaceae bacterium]|nr:helix-turn-helix domain-containing protein [Terrimicrobiaceae bacterium]
MPNSRKNQREKAAAHEPPPTLGAILRSAREARGIPIEMAAHHTRIRASRLREMEADDLSHLPPAYARYFVNHYAGYLKVPQAAIRGFLPEADAFGVDGYQYIANAASDSPEPHRPRPRRTHKSALRAALALAAVLLVLG